MDAIMKESCAKKTLIPLRGYYLFNGMTGGIFNPYLSLLLVHNGFTSTEIGLVIATATLVGMIAQPLWGQLVDRFEITRSALWLGALVPAMLVIFYNTTWIWVLFIVTVTSSFFSNPQTPIADAYAITITRASDTSYSTVRIFGSLGYATGAYLAGQFLTRFTVSILWLPRAVIGLFTVLTALFLPRFTSSVRFKRAGLSGWHPFLSNRRFLLFLTGGFFLSAILTAYDTYFALAFREIGGPLNWTGVAFMIASLSNIPAMLLATRLIAKFGKEKTLLLAVLAYCTRFAVMAWLKIPILDVFIQILHGASFGFFYIAAVDYVSYLSPPDLQATGQSLFGMVCGGLAVMVGNFTNGVLLHRGGPSLMYGTDVFAAVLAGICFALLALSATHTIQHANEVEDSVHS
ncbi:MFS transporter [Sulfoacidibacillus thermotolerans]